MSSPVIPLGQSWDGVLGGLAVSMQYDAATRTVHGTVQNTLSEKLCYVQAEPHLKSGTITVGELGPEKLGNLNPGQETTSSLSVASEPELAGVSYDGYVVHMEVFDCSGPGPVAHSGGEGAEGGGERGPGGEEGSGANALAPDETFDEVRSGARLILSYDAASNSFKGTVENTTEGVLDRVRIEVHLSNGVELGPTTPTDMAPRRGGDDQPARDARHRSLDGRHTPRLAPVGEGSESGEEHRNGGELGGGSESGGEHGSGGEQRKRRLVPNGSRPRGDVQSSSEMIRPLAYRGWTARLYVTSRLRWLRRRLAMSGTVLIIEDDARIANWVKVYFERAGFSAEVAHDGKHGLALARDLAPDLIILDLMLPRLDGVELCRILRRESDVPIIMLTAREAHSERIIGLDSGADDYIVKPFDPEEVIARADAVLRRVKGRVQQVLTRGNITLNETTRSVTVNEEPVVLSQAQIALLSTFMRHPNQVLTRDQLISLTFDHGFDGFDRAIDSQIARLRKQINRDGRQPIQTVYGAGYRFVVEEE